VTPVPEGSPWREGWRSKYANEGEVGGAPFLSITATGGLFLGACGTGRVYREPELAPARAESVTPVPEGSPWREGWRSKYANEGEVGGGGDSPLGGQ
jgi:hypothetical protein